MVEIHFDRGPDRLSFDPAAARCWPMHRRDGCYGGSYAWRGQDRNKVLETHMPPERLTELEAKQNGLTACLPDIHPG